MTKKDSRRLLITQIGLVLLGLIISQHRSQEIRAFEKPSDEPGLNDYPSPPRHGKSNWIDVTKSPYFADNTGRQDCTKAILSAMRDLQAQSNGRTSHYNVLSAVYFPDGVYLVSDKLTFGKGRARSMHLRGQSRQGTIIKLKPNADGFQDANNPKPLLTFFDAEGGHSNDAFNNAIDNLTLEIGPGNPGVVGVDFHNNNNGYIKGLVISSRDGSGVAGLRIHHGAAGIGYIKELSITGFDYAITVKEHKINYVFEHIRISDQRKAGLLNDGKPVQVRDLHSTNRVPAIQNINQGGQIVLLDSVLSSQGGPVAIDNRAGALFVRNVMTEGYDAAVRNGEEVIPDGKIEEYVGGGIYTLFDDAPKTSLNLPIKETPAVPWDDPSDWAYVSPGGRGDSTRAIQAAIDSGKRTVCLLPGTYRISEPIRLRGSVRRLYGSYAHIRIPEAYTRLRPEDKFAVLIEDSSEPVRIIEMLGCGSIQNASNNTIVLRHVQCQGYRNTGTGDLFLEGVQGDLTNTCSTSTRMPVWLFKDQSVWVRHINPEGAYPHIVNDGGRLWIMGYKLGENLGPYIISRNGAKTEVLGGYCNALSACADAQRAMFINDNSDMTVIAAEGVATWYAYPPQSPHAFAVCEFRNGRERRLSHDDIVKRKNNAEQGGLIALYNGRSAIRPGTACVSMEALEPETDQTGQSKATLRVSRQGDTDDDLQVALCIDGDSTFIPGELPPLPTYVTIPKGQSSVDLRIDTRLESHAANGRRDLVVGLSGGPGYRVVEQTGFARFVLENSTVDIVKGLLLHYSFEGEMGRDDSGNEYHAESVHHVKPFKDGKLAAAEFEKDSSIIISRQYRTDQSSFIRSFADKTVALWVKPHEINHRQVLYSEGNRGVGYSLLIDNGVVVAGLHDRAGVQASVMKEVRLNQWQHVALVISRGAVSLYLDGELAGTQNTPSVRLRYSYQKNLVAGLGTESFTGCLADVRVYDRPLNSAEIGALKSQYNK